MVSVDEYRIGLFGDDPLGVCKSSPIDNYIWMMHEEKIGNVDIRTVPLIHEVPAD